MFIQLFEKPRQSYDFFADWQPKILLISVSEEWCDPCYCLKNEQLDRGGDALRSHFLSIHVSSCDIQHPKFGEIM